MEVSVAVTDLAALLGKHHALLIILTSPHVYISDQNRKPLRAESLSQEQMDVQSGPH